MNLCFACLSLNLSWAYPHFDDELKSPSDVLSFMLMWWTMFTFLISVDWIIKLMDFIRTRDPGSCAAAAAGHKRQQIYFIYWLIETKINTGSRFPPEQSVKVWRRASEHQTELQIPRPGRGWVGTFPRRWRNNGGTFDTIGQLSPLSGGKKAILSIKMYIYLNLNTIYIFSTSSFENM